ncbi:unnamed protein product [Musa hybrid cultivar]
MAETIETMISINSENDWIGDSECGHHLIGDDNKFINLHQYEDNDVIITTNNTVHQVKKDDVIIISNKDNDHIMLKSMYHVPSTKKNIFSFANVVDAENYILFCLNKIKFLRNIKELNTGIIQVKGQRFIYFLARLILLKFQKFKLTVESALKRIIKRLCIVNGRDRFFFVCKEYNIKR